MLVYRFEDYNGEGIYTGEAWSWGKACDLLDKNPWSHGDELHPALDARADYPDHALVPFMADRFYCGFTSLAQLGAWFTLDEIRALLEVSCTLQVYECPEALVFFSEFQAIFDKGASTVVGSYTRQIDIVNAMNGY